MLRNYFKIGFRNLWKSKGYTAVNITGLSVAFCICVFLFLISYLQLTFDSFHDDRDRIFKTYFVSNDVDKTNRSGNMPMPLEPALKTDFPEIEGAARIMGGRKSAVEFNGKYFDKMVVMTDPDFFRVFSFRLIKGNKAYVLNNLSGMVISQDMAAAVFGEDEPLGQTLVVGSGGDRKQYVVTGIVENAPFNSSIQYDALARIENSGNYASDQKKWDANSHELFIKLPPNVDQAAFEGRLKPFTKKYYGGTIDELTKKGAKPDQLGDIFAIRLQNLSKVHFDREISGGKGAPVALVYTLLAIAIFILLIACINFINLSIARSFTRAREVGVRKSLGALKKQLFVQIWGETTMICLAGFLAGGLLTYLLLSTFNAAFGTKLTFDQMLQPGFVMLVIAIFVIVTLTAGGYPAWQMAKFNAVEVLKGKVSMKKPGLLRNSLIVTQFSISTLLVCCTIIAVQQVDYMQSIPLGFQKEQVISIPVGNQLNGRQILARMRNTLASDPSVLSITGTGVNLGRGKDKVSSRSVLGFKYKGKEVSTDWLLVDFDYLKTLNIKLKSGRDFDRSFAADSSRRVIISESMAKMMGEANPVGLFLGDDADSSGAKSQIIGVVPDFQVYSLSEERRPLTLHISGSETIYYIFVRVTPQSLAASMEKLKGVWQQIAPETEFLGTFLDENLDGWYQNEKKLSEICSLASGIAIFLSCLGLFALALMVIEQRTKEIGIRKVMGASVPNIILVLSSDFVRLVGIALVISIPLAWFGMQQWLANYPERIDLSIWVFALVAFAAIIITFVTVGFHTIKAALVNPVESLRNE
jgi:putative ABC transport system permease protein